MSDTTPRVADSATPRAKRRDFGRFGWGQAGFGRKTPSS